VVEALPGLDVEVAPWHEETEAEQISRMDIGIMPLPDGPWEKGKCGYKLIQYMATGIPVVASPVGVNVDIVSNSQCGILASTSDDWFNALDTLLREKEIRQQYGVAGRKAVERTYSLQVQSQVLSRIFNSIPLRRAV